MAPGSSGEDGEAANGSTGGDSEDKAEAILQHGGASVYQVPELAVLFVDAGQRPGGRRDSSGLGHFCCRCPGSRPGGLAERRPDKTPSAGGADDFVTLACNGGSGAGQRRPIPLVPVRRRVMRGLAILGLAILGLATRGPALRALVLPALAPAVRTLAVPMLAGRQDLPAGRLAVAEVPALAVVQAEARVGAARAAPVGQVELQAAAALEARAVPAEPAARAEPVGPLARAAPAARAPATTRHNQCRIA